MKRIFLATLAFGVLSCSSTLQAQTLFTFGNHPVSKAEFIRIYEKNNAQKHPDFSAKSVNEYLNLYSLFRMKVQDADEIQLDTTAAVKNELNNYKNQLAKSYLIDKSETKNLVQEAYDRSKFDVRVEHILVAIRPGADSAKAKEKIDSIYNVLINKKVDFSTLAKSVSDDKSTASKGGDLGYFTALQVTYPFETVAYETPVGHISKPFLTQYGWHILKVLDKRPDQGQVQVAQIMIGAPANSSGIENTAALKKAQEVEKKLSEGVPFENLVAQYSEDKYTMNNKGVMEPFGIGKVTPSFEDAAFALKKPGDISKPVLTEYGYHIIKLIKKIPLKSFEEEKDNLTRAIENDSRSAIAKAAYLEKVKKEYNFKEFPENLTSFLNAFRYDTSKVLVKSNYAAFDKPLFELNNKTYTQSDFLDFVFKLTNGKIFGDKVNSLKDIYQSYFSVTLQDLQIANLEKTNPEFKALVKEYKNGIMLFDLMDKKVWNKASNDSIGLRNFYEQNSAKYQWNPGFEGTIYTSTSKEELTKLIGYLTSGLDKSDALTKLTGDKAASAVSDQSGRFEFDKLPLSANVYTKDKLTNIFENSDHTYSFINPTLLYPKATTKTLEEAKGFVIADYQDFLEKEWNQQLKAKYPLKVNEKVLKSIIK